MVPGTFIWRQWISPCQLLTHGFELFSQLSAYRQLGRSRTSYPAAFGPTSQQSRRPGVPKLPLIIKSALAKARWIKARSVFGAILGACAPITPRQTPETV